MTQAQVNIWDCLDTPERINAFFDAYKAKALPITLELREKCAPFLAPKVEEELVETQYSVKAQKVAKAVAAMKSNVCEDVRVQITKLLSIVLEEDIPPVVTEKGKKRKGDDHELEFEGGAVFLLTQDMDDFKANALAIVDRDGDIFINACGRTGDLDDSFDPSDETNIYIPATAEQVETFFEHCKTIALSGIGVDDNLFDSGKYLLTRKG